MGQSNHLETFTARRTDGKAWKYTRYFDNPQFWSSSSDAGEDGVVEQKEPTPEAPFGPAPLLFEVTVKAAPATEEIETYNVTDDPMELDTLYRATEPLPEQPAAPAGGAPPRAMRAKASHPLQRPSAGPAECGQKTCTVYRTCHRRSAASASAAVLGGLPRIGRNGSRRPWRERT